MIDISAHLADLPADLGSTYGLALWPILQACNILKKEIIFPSKRLLADPLADLSQWYKPARWVQLLRYSSKWLTGIGTSLLL